MARFISSLALISVIAADVFGQSPDMTVECRQWDDAFVTNFYVGVLIASLVTFLACFFSGVIEKIFPGPWMRRQPWYRCFWAWLVITITTAVVLVFVPKWYLGAPIYSGVDPMYRACVTQAFGAAGLLNGRVGAGTAAYAQKPALILIVFSSCSVAALLAWALGRRKAAKAIAVSE